MPLILRFSCLAGLPNMSSAPGVLAGEGSSRSSPGPSLSGGCSVWGENSDRDVVDDDGVDEELSEEGRTVDASSKYATNSSVRSVVAAGAGREKKGRLMRLYERGVFFELW